MKRDMELIRALVFAIEDAGADIESTSLKCNGFTAAQIAYHCELLAESELIECTDNSHLGSVHAEFLIHRLTSKGHDFADAARSDAIWTRSMKTVKETVGAVTINVLLQYLQTEARRVLGLP